MGGGEGQGHRHVPALMHSNASCCSGYRIDIKEAEALLDQLDTRHTGEVERRQLAASQIDWAAIQQDHEPQFIEAARRTFSALDTDGDGYWSCEEILECLESRLAPTEVGQSFTPLTEKRQARSSGTDDEHGLDVT